MENVKIWNINISFNKLNNNNPTRHAIENVRIITSSKNCRVQIGKKLINGKYVSPRPDRHTSSSNNNLKVPREHKLHYTPEVPTTKKMPMINDKELKKWKYL